MPVVTPPGTVLLTGASGFIATWIGRSLLENGYNVVGTVRSAAKGEYVKALYNDLASSGAVTFQYTLVEDIASEGAFDEAVQRVNPDAIIHAASPVAIVDETVDPQTLIAPAVKGTLNILAAALNYGTKIKRIVMLSSGAAITQLFDQPHVYTEDDWNKTSVVEVNSLGKRAAPIHKIRASATLAERAAWDWIGKHKDAPFDFVTILPPYVFGPMIQEIDPKNLNFSSAMFIDPLKTPYEGARLLARSINYVDVRDIALLIALSVAKDGIAGERIIGAAGVMYWQDLYDVLNSLNPPLEGIHVPKGQPEAHKGPHDQIYSNEKANRLFGIKWRSLKETAVDTVLSAHKLGAI